MISKNHTDPEYPDKTGERLDGRNQTKEWVEKHPNARYVWNKTAFENIDTEEVDHVMGEFLEHFGTNVSVAWVKLLSLKKRESS